jgi:dephospho-CoA kinase
MLNLRKVAITGGLSCGKSSVCRFFKEFGAYVVSADDIVHHLLSSDTTLGKKVIELLGPDIIINHKLDRKLIAKKVFNHPLLLKSLENILHPSVNKEVENQYQKVKNSGKNPFFVAEIPLLFETGGEKKYDYTVAVLANNELCLERFMKSSGYEKNEFEKRMAMQLSPEEKAALADEVIFNRGSLEELRQTCKDAFDRLLNKFTDN